MPDLPILDTHVHFWDTGRLSYPWLDGYSSLSDPHLMPDLASAIGEHDVREIIMVEAGPALEDAVREVEWVNDMQHPNIAIRGIVARADLCQGDAARASLMELVRLPNVKGIRDNLQGIEKLGDLVDQGDLIRGVEVLSEFDLSFDICIKHHQLPATIRLVDACPDTQFILNHVAKPDIRTRALDPWRANIRKLAERENVYCKLSGMVTEASKAWKVDHLRPFVEHVIECFGWHRVCYGGDWPVCNLAATYSQQLSALDEIVAGCTRDESDALWCLNGRRFYRVDDA